jgi:hypothetical protein
MAGVDADPNALGIEPRKQELDLVLELDVAAGVLVNDRWVWITSSLSKISLYRLAQRLTVDNHRGWRDDHLNHKTGQATLMTARFGKLYSRSPIGSLRARPIDCRQALTGVTLSRRCCVKKQVRGCLVD